MKYELCPVFDFNRLRLWKNAFGRIDGFGRVCIGDNKRVSKANIIRCRLKLLFLKWLESDPPLFHCGVNIFI